MGIGFPADSFSYDLYQYALLPSSIELPIKDLFSRTKIQFPFCYGHYDFSPHYLPLDVRVGIVFPSIIVAVLVDRFMRSQFLQPRLIIVEKTPLVVVDEDGRRDVHGVYQSESFPDSALTNALLYLGSNVDESAAGRRVKPEFFSIAFHMTDYLHTPEHAKDQVILRCLTFAFNGAAQRASAIAAR